MLGIMGIGAAFINAAKAHAKKGAENIISLYGVKEDPSIYQLSCLGDITIESVKNGEPVLQTYSDLTDTLVSIQADANTVVVIKGNVTKYNAGQYQGWGYADLVCAERLVFSGNAITEISGISGKGSYSDTSKTTEIDVTKAVALQTLNCYNCTSLTSLDLAANVALQTLNCNGCTSLTTIKYPAANSDVSTAIAGAITDAESADGKVYTDSAADYYSTILDAATAKGWTIEQL